MRFWGKDRKQDNRKNIWIEHLNIDTGNWFQVFSACLRRWTKGYTIKQPNMDCQPTEITALMRHRAVFS